MQCGSRFIFLGYQERWADQDDVFQPGSFGVVALIDGDGVPVCFLTDECGKVVWWQPETLFPEEFILLRYAPLISRDRIPIPYGDLVGQPR